MRFPLAVLFAFNADRLCSAAFPIAATATGRWHHVSGCDIISFTRRFEWHCPPFRNEAERLTIGEIHDVADRTIPEIDPVDPFSEFPCETRQHENLRPARRSAHSLSTR